jgi:hypothetical protein
VSKTIDDLNDLTEIRDAVLAVMTERGGAKPFQLLGPVADRLRVSRFSTAPGYARQRAEERFYRRVKRSLDLLAADGKLVKVPAGDRLPDGKPQSRGEVHYYTPEAFARAVTDREEREAADRALASRHHYLRVRLARAGIIMNGDGSLALSDLECLLKMAGL